MFKLKRLIPHALVIFAMLAAAGHAPAAQADRYDDPATLGDEVIDPVDTSENHAVFILDYA